MLRLALMAGLGLALAGCNQPKAGAPPPPYRTGHTVPEIMDHVIDPAARVVWANAGYVITAKGEEELWPKTDEGWHAVENAAVTVAESSNLLLLPGRPRGGEDWTRFAHQLSDAGMAAARAAEAKDKEGLFKTGGQIYEACLACHREYVQGEKPPK
jgi:hypothetical protein